MDNASEKFKQEYLKKHPEMNTKIFTKGEYDFAVANSKDMGYDNVTDYLRDLREQTASRKEYTTDNGVAERRQEHTGSITNGNTRNELEIAKRRTSETERKTQQDKNENSTRLSEINLNSFSANKELWKEVESQDTSIKKSVFNQLNRDRFGIVQRGDKAYIEATNGAKIPDNVYNYVEKWLKEKGFNRNTSEIEQIAPKTFAKQKKVKPNTKIRTYISDTINANDKYYSDGMYLLKRNKFELTGRNTQTRDLNVSQSDAIWNRFSKIEDMKNLEPTGRVWKGKELTATEYKYTDNNGEEKTLYLPKKYSDLVKGYDLSTG